MDSEIRARRYLHSLGVRDLPARTIPFDPGYDPATFESHLQQSGHLFAMVKLSMACWQIADAAATRRKIAAARSRSVPVCTGGGPFEVAVARGRLPEYLDLCAAYHFDFIEAGSGFTDMAVEPAVAVRLAEERGLKLHFEVGEKHTGSFGNDEVDSLLEQGRRWLDAGAEYLVVEGRESACSVGLFSDRGELDTAAAERFVEAFGMDRVIFEAPTKASQFAFIRHLGPEVLMTNVRLEEVLRVEIFRRGLHSDAFQYDHLRPQA